MSRLLFDPRMQAAAFLVWCIVWAVLALFSVRPTIPETPFTDTQLHFIAYAGMSFMAIAFCVTGRQLFLWALASVGAGFAMECMQILIPTRNFQMIDLIANTTGAVAGYLLAAAVLYMLVRPLRRSLA